MTVPGIRRLLVAGLLAVGSAAFALSASYPAGAAPSGGTQSGAGDCIAHAPTASGEYQIGYTGGDAAGMTSLSWTRCRGWPDRRGT